MCISMPGKRRLYVFWTLFGSMPTWRRWFVFVLPCDLDIEETLYHTRQNDSNAQKKGLRPLWANYCLDRLCFLCLSVTSDSSRVILSILDRLCQSIRGHKEVGAGVLLGFAACPIYHTAFLALSLTQFPTPGSLQAWVFIDTIYIVLNFHYSLLHTFFFFGSWKIDFSV